MPEGIAVTPDSQSMCVASGSTATCGTSASSGARSSSRVGALQALDPAAVSAGARPDAVAPSTDGQELFVTDAAGAVGQFAANPAGGCHRCLPFRCRPASSRVGSR